MPAYHACVPCLRTMLGTMLGTMPGYHACVPCLRTMPGYHACVPCLRTMPAYHACVPCLRTMPAYHACVPCLRTMPRYYGLGTLPAYCLGTRVCSCECAAPADRRVRRRLPQGHRRRQDRARPLCGRKSTPSRTSEYTAAETDPTDLPALRTLDRTGSRTGSGLSGNSSGCGGVSGNSCCGEMLCLYRVSTLQPCAAQRNPPSARFSTRSLGHR
jgi:hypothetical protein